MFKKATREKIKLRLAIAAPSGAGKSYTSLKIASRFGKIAVIDTENRSASRYADQFDFDVLEMDAPFHPDRLIEALTAAEKSGYDIVIVDSLSHFWAGQGGILEIVDQVKIKNSRSGNYNGFTAWKDGTAIFNEMVEKIIRCKIHIICTMRSKSEYLQTEDDRGKKKIEKVGTAPIQRDGLEYEFDLVYDMDLQHRAVVSKSRVFGAPEVIREPGTELAELLYRWTETGEEPTPRQSSGESAAQVKAEQDHARYLERLRELFKQVYGTDAKAFADTFGVEAKELPSLSIAELEAIGRGLKALADKPKLEPPLKDTNPEKYDAMRAKLFAVAGEIWPEDSKDRAEAYGWLAEQDLLAVHPDGNRRSVSHSTEKELSAALKALDKHHLTLVTLAGPKN